MNKTLIIPDLHHRWKQAEAIISKVEHDNVIFLGDYFDDFYDTAEMVQDTVDWLESSVSKPNRLHLFGNHDIHYAFPYHAFQCSGYEQWKYFIVHDRIDPKVWDKVKWYTFLDDTWLLSHGGLHNLNVPKNIAAKHKNRKKFIKALDEWLQAEIITGFRNGASGISSWIFNAGAARWGNQRVGGIIWCDFEREFYPVRGINQIVGHTPQGLGFPKWCVLFKEDRVSFPPAHLFTPTREALDDTNTSFNIDLDVHKNTHWAVWDGQKLTIGNYNEM